MQGMKLKKYSDDQKLERSLKKRLRAIDAIQAKQNNGEELDAGQKEKLTKLKVLTRELRILEGKEVSDDEGGDEGEEKDEAAAMEVAEEEESDEESDEEKQEAKPAPKAKKPKTVAAKKRAQAVTGYDKKVKKASKKRQTH